MHTREEHELLLGTLAQDPGLQARVLMACLDCQPDQLTMFRPDPPRRAPHRRRRRAGQGADIKLTI